MTDRRGFFKKLMGGSALAATGNPLMYAEPSAKKVSGPPPLIRTCAIVLYSDETPVTVMACNFDTTNSMRWVNTETVKYTTIGRGVTINRAEIYDDREQMVAREQMYFCLGDLDTLTFEKGMITVNISPA